MRKLIALAAVLALVTGYSDPCRNTVIVRDDAPDGRHAAVLFQRDCGATTGFSTQISILDVGKDPADAGNAFRADDGHGAAQTAAWGGPWADLRWLSPKHLLIRYDAKARIFEQKVEISGVRISYEKVSW
jgi:hypothetical protein